MSESDGFLRGAVDIHVHTSPDLQPRRYTDLELGRLARRHGLRAAVVKCHHESTVGRAADAAEASGAELFGGLVLRRRAGGIDPDDAAAALDMGARIVWLPTLTAPAHLAYFGGGPPEGEWLAEADARRLCREVAAHGAVVGSGHAGPATVARLAEAAEEEGARMVITHPDYVIPDLDVEAQAAFAERYPSAWFERCAYSFLEGSPAPAPLSRVVEAIEATGGSARNVVSSDLGQPEMPAWPDGLESFCSALAEAGIAASAVGEMVAEAPAALLGLDREPALTGDRR